MKKYLGLSNIFGRHEYKGTFKDLNKRNVGSVDKRTRNWTLGDTGVKRLQRAGEGSRGGWKTVIALYSQIAPGPHIIGFYVLSSCNTLVHRAVTIALRIHLFHENACFISASQHLFARCSLASLLPRTWSFMPLLPVPMSSHPCHRCHC